jgi:hypothetical protein
MSEALPALVIVLLLSMCTSCDFGDPVPVGKVCVVEKWTERCQ